MKHNRRSIVILMADDDLDDQYLAKEALSEAHVCNEMKFVNDGEELMDYLHHRGKFVDEDLSPRPGLILLDLNMPKKDGREAMEEIKNDPSLRRIPIIILTTSRAEEDILRTYDLGASGFITKPVSFGDLIEVMRAIGKYWLDIVELPE